MPVTAMTSEPAMTRKRFIIRSQESGARSQEHPTSKRVKI
jgi:hypothetical protein